MIYRSYRRRFIDYTQSCLAVALLFMSLCFTEAKASQVLPSGRELTPYISSILVADSAGVLFDAISHNFGSIAEEKGQVYHAFSFTNTGNAPLVITRVTADCGCTTPNWPEGAILPGQSGKIGVYFNPAGRPGSFVKYIHIYSNVSQAPVTISIKGTVSTLGGSSSGMYSTMIGPLELSRSRLIFPTVSVGNEAEMRLLLNNPTNSVLSVQLKSVPSFVKADCAVRILSATEPTEYVLTLSTNSKDTKPGIYSEPLRISVTTADGQIFEGIVDIDAVLADDFSSRNPDDDHPAMQVRTYFDLESASPSSKPIDLVIDLHNAGEQILVIHTVQSTEKAVEVIRFVSPMSIKPKKKGKIHLRVSPQMMAQEGKNEISTNVSILCNDPAAPLRRVKIKLRLKSPQSDK